MLHRYLEVTAFVEPGRSGGKSGSEPSEPLYVCATHIFVSRLTHTRKFSTTQRVERMPHQEFKKGTLKEWSIAEMKTRANKQNTSAIMSASDVRCRRKDKEKPILKGAEVFTVHSIHCTTAVSAKEGAQLQLQRAHSSLPDSPAQHSISCATCSSCECYFA